MRTFDYSFLKNHIPGQIVSIGPAEIDAAIAAFGSRDRRFGGVKDAGKG